MSMKICSLKSSHGFSLIELIVALSMIGLLVAIFFPLIANSYYGISSTGHRNQVLYKVQQGAESNSANSEVSYTTQTSYPQTISFPSAGINNLTITGILATSSIISSTYPYSITVFKPYGSLQK